MLRYLSGSSYQQNLLPPLPSHLTYTTLVYQNNQNWKLKMFSSGRFQFFSDTEPFEAALDVELKEKKEKNSFGSTNS